MGLLSRTISVLLVLATLLSVWIALTRGVVHRIESSSEFEGTREYSFVTPAGYLSFIAIAVLVPGTVAWFWWRSRSKARGRD